MIAAPVQSREEAIAAHFEPSGVPSRVSRRTVLDSLPSLWSNSGVGFHTTT